MPVISKLTAPNAVICPFIADYAPASVLNVESNVKDLVTINNINEEFTLEVTDLKKMFDCSGWGVAVGLGVSGELLKGLIVELSGNLLHDTLAAAIDVSGSLALDASGEGVPAYLVNRFSRAFIKAFPDYAGAKSEVRGNVNFYTTNVNNDRGDGAIEVSGNIINPGAPATDGTKFDPSPVDVTAPGEADTSDQVGEDYPGSYVQKVTVSDYAFRIDVSGHAMAAAMTDNLTAGSKHLNTLFMQLPYDKIGRNANTTTGARKNNDLPLEDGDSVTFVFDIDVAVSGLINDSGAPGPAGGLPDAENGGYAQGVDGIQMDLGTRRVAITLVHRDSA